MKWEIVCADVIEWAENYDGPPFHALICDPPYHLYSRRTAGEKDQSGFPGGRANPGKGGFMGQKWDGGDIAFNPDTWRALTKHLFPGAFGMVFASSRGWHRLAVAIEDAGLRIHPSIFGWVTGQSFPKATRIDTQVDRAAGIERQRQPAADDGPAYQRSIGNTRPWMFDENRTVDSGIAVTDLAKAWEGHRYGGQILKNALEPIILFQKPYEGKPVDSITRTGAGALNIDGGRIALIGPHGTEGRRKFSGFNTSDGFLGKDFYTRKSPPNFQGRWPANFYLQHLPACCRVKSKSNQQQCQEVEEWECHPECPVFKLGQQSGESKSVTRVSEDVDTPRAAYALGRTGITPRGHSDKGTAARFFLQTDWHYEIAEQLNAADPVKYQAKASRRERDAGLGELPLQTFNRVNPGGLENEERWAPTEVRNFHPTVKPIGLAKWLATLVLPPEMHAPRRLVIPFCGTFSEGIGGMLGGWEEIVGIDSEESYCEIGEARAKWWQVQIESGLRDVKEILKRAKPKKKRKKQEAVQKPLI